LIIRSNLGLENNNWSDLIAMHIASELHNPELSSSIQAIMKNLVLKTGHGQVNFKHGLVTVKEPGKNNDEIAYLFDADFYTEQKIERDGNVWNILEQSNKSAKRLFRWSITDILHNAMQPQAVDATDA
jgi:uncharacterized protein (TIGR04255 family)